MGSRIGSLYLPYAYAALTWALVVLEIPRSFGHEDPLNRRLVSGTLLTTLASLLRLSVPTHTSDAPPTWPYCSQFLGGR